MDKTCQYYKTCYALLFLLINFFSFILHTTEVSPPVFLPITSAPLPSIPNPLLFHLYSEKGNHYKGFKESMSCHCEVGPRSFPCIKAGGVIFACGLGSQNQFAREKCPYPTAKESHKQNSYPTVIYMQKT